MREDAADLREGVASLREQALSPQEEALDLREDAAGLREDAAALREQALQGVPSKSDTVGDTRETAADLRDDAATQRERRLEPQERTADLREEAVDLREDAAEHREASATSREQSLRPKEEFVRVNIEHGLHLEAQLREANEHLVIATMKSQTMAAAAIHAAEQIAQMAQVEARLQEIQKVETLGTLAGGVAHDFNNLLTAILGNADLGRGSVQPGGMADHHFEAIEGAALRAADLTRQLLAYTGQGQILMTRVDLGAVVKEIVLLLQVSIPQKITLDCRLAEGLPPVKGDATQLFQVVMNLTTNAGEAFALGATGCISIRTRAEILDEATTGCDGWILPLPPGSYVTLEVTDTGGGMTQEILARVFEPFYTTKFTGRGLGLAAVIGIIRSHEGGLRVQSELGCGTSFKVFLPVIPLGGVGANLSPQVSSPKE